MLFRSEQTTRLLESVLKENKRLGKLLEEKHEEWFELMDEINNQETLSEYWIEQKSIDTHVDTLNGEVQVTFRLDDLQNLLVPKGWTDGIAAYVEDLHSGENLVVIEKPTIPQFIADWVEESRNRGYNIRGVLEEAPKIVENWLYFQDDGERIIYLGLAYLLDEYEVEERELTVKEVIEEHIELLKKQEVAVNLKPYYDLWKELKEYEELEKEPDAKKITEKNTKY